MLPRPASLLAVLIAVLTALTTSWVVAPAPAQAAVVGTTTSKDMVLRNRCVEHPIRYDLGIGPGTLLWKVKISVVTPSGTRSEGVDLSSVKDSPVKGTVGYLVCGSADPGTYTVETTGIYQVLPALNLPVAVPDSTFRARRAHTRTGLSAAHLGGKRWRLTALVRDERKAGFKPTESAVVHFQRKEQGRWKKLRGSLRQTDSGRAAYVVTARRGVKVRAVTAQAGYLGGSVSRVVRLRG